MRICLLILGLLCQAGAARWSLPVSLLGFDAQGHAVTTSTSDGVTRLEVRDTGTGQLLRAAPVDDPGPGVAFSADVTVAAWVRADTLHVWRAGQDVAVPAAQNGLAGTQVLALSPDGTQLYAGNFSGYVQVWNTQTATRERTLPQRTWGVNRLRVSPDGQRLFVGTQGGDSRVYDTREWSFTALPDVFAKTVHSVAFSPDGTQLAVADGVDPARLLNLRDPAQSRTLPRPTAPCDVTVWRGRCATGPVTLNFSADGQTLLIAHMNGLAVLYDVQTGRPRTQVSGTEPGQTLLSPDGRTVLSGGIWHPPLRALNVP
ncbi:hypothetical protein GCM10008959_14900 [Deinococcus seoulensis]|uniref:WD40 repeat domain-containing protein n=1 Tax=Deinococcus seoulensis TaxID=1837379 RepID=A0ABQ2RSV9_9DEIO|nr:hypothetical protein [Deinococcus seoulensis]GGR54265.1 hypothetical protein GCM10008959_14900 [Deinococcus seoulensis]